MSTMTTGNNMYTEILTFTLIIMENQCWSIPGRHSAMPSDHSRTCRTALSAPSAVHALQQNVTDNQH